MPSNSFQNESSPLGLLFMLPNSQPLRRMLSLAMSPLAGDGVKTMAHSNLDSQ